LSFTFDNNMKMIILKQTLKKLCCAIFIIGGLAFAGDDKVDSATKDSKREVLWRKVIEACPPEYRKIQIYATNTELTKVCFRSGGKTFIYSTKTGKVEAVIHAKKIAPGINRITWDKSGFFLLWYYGGVELKIGAGE
jgi:hypothetical protein